MKKKVNILFISAVIVSLSIALSFAQDTTELVERGKETSVFVIAEFKLNDESQSITKAATGFVIDTSKSAGLIIATNRHNLEHKMNGKLIKPYKITIKVNMSKAEQTLYNAEIIALHESYDIGLLLPKDLIKIPKDAKLNVAGDKQYYSWRTKALLLESHIADDSNIKEGLEVFFSGFPLSLGKEKIKNYPITRKGMVAQAIPDDKEFVIDGFASSGNSGSPVYYLIGDSIKLLGILRGVYTDHAFGENKSNSGLSIVIKASVIKDFIYELIDGGKYKGAWSN